MSYLRLIFIVLLSLAILLGGVLVYREEFGGVGENEEALPRLVFYTAPTATTPQLPLWHAYHYGGLSESVSLDVNNWKDLHSLSVVMLSGKGDIWLGHLEGFARAKAKGAPVALLAITAWRKFYLLSSDGEVKGFDDLLGRVLHTTPPGSPAVALLAAMLKDKASQVEIVTYAPNQLSLLMLREPGQIALVPEPLVSMLLENIPTLKVVANLEEEFSRRFGGGGYLPLAGIAVNRDSARKHPQLVEQLLSGMLEAEESLNAAPDAAFSLLPSDFLRHLSEDVFLASLSRDLIMVRSAIEVRAEIERYLAIVEPELFDAEGQFLLGSDFYWSRE